MFGTLGLADIGSHTVVMPSLLAHFHFHTFTFTISLSLFQDIGSHTVVMPRLLAHEFGHLLGSDHDGDRAG